MISSQALHAPCSGEITVGLLDRGGGTSTAPDSVAAPDPLALLASMAMKICHTPLPTSMATAAACTFFARVCLFLATTLMGGSPLNVVPDGNLTVSLNAYIAVPCFGTATLKGRFLTGG